MSDPASTPQPAHAGRFDLGGRSLRTHTARGTLINGGFSAGLMLLGALKGFVVAVLLAPEEFGIWGILVITLGTLGWLKQVGISDKYIQQDEEDQELAFQRAFTFEVVINAVLLCLVAAAVPLMALVYGRPELLAPGFATLALLPAITLQAPLWILYRRLRYTKQRALQAIDPVAGFLVTVVLAIAGAGYWSLVIGVIAGAWASAAAALISCPYPLRWRWDRGVLRSYVSFSTPLFVASFGGIVIAQGSVLVSESAVGLVGAGAVALAANITILTDRLDHMITSTLYPAICAVADRTELLFESFVKSNRLALMWALPFGIGLALFTDDLIQFVLGNEWEPAAEVLQAFGLAAALNHLGFNWTAYFRARGTTRPIAVNSVATCIAFLAVTVPLVYAHGLRGFAIGTAIGVVVSLAIRAAYLVRLFSGFQIGRHALRAIAPSVPAVGLILLARVLEAGGQRTLGLALAELATYVAVTALATWVLERELLREALGYLHRSAPAAAAPA
ncbi:MAG: oligosaccharide flippase family protein [Solirubrobacterales bacterium]|nr:oligosaccharide flippase family protein [Solirubrobacterales bacterium]